MSDHLNLTTQSAWRSWLLDKALPLWSTAGFDKRRGLYHERLTWKGCPVPMAGLRLMVQARQVATYCRATLDGLYDASEPALRCLDLLERLYLQRDGQPGWVFSLAPDNMPKDTTRDLYTHAFVLFAYGWSLRLNDNSHQRLAARRTAADIGTLFATGGYGYKGSFPAADSLRHQNPHMHLLEAYLVLFESTNDDFYLAEAHKLVRLALDHLVDARSGLLLEVFDENWKPLGSFGHNKVEAGHLFEWVWLLYEYERLTDLDHPFLDRLPRITETLFQTGMAFGCDATTGFVVDSITEDGKITEYSTRIWPQTELLRLFCRRSDLKKGHYFSPNSIFHTFLERYAPENLSGGWIDRLDSNSTPLVDHMPASSLYHIYGAARDLTKMDFR